MTQKTHWRKLVNTPYLGSHDIEDKNPEPVLTIKTVAREMVTGDGGKKEECTVAHFAEPVKPMILNRTNCKTITSMYKTPYIEEWAGKKIQIFVAQVKVAGEVMDALRVKPRIPEVARFDPTEVIGKINACKTMEELEKVFRSLGKNIAADPKVIEAKDNKKTELSNGN